MENCSAKAAGDGRHYKVVNLLYNIVIAHRASLSPLEDRHTIIQQTRQQFFASDRLKYEDLMHFLCCT